MLEDKDEFAGCVETLAESELGRVVRWLEEVNKEPNKERRIHFLKRVATQLKVFSKFYDRYLAILCREVRP